MGRGFLLWKNTVDKVALNDILGVSTFNKTGGWMKQEQTPLFNAEGVPGDFPEPIENIFFPQKDGKTELCSVMDSWDDNCDGFFLNGGFPVT